MLPGNSSSAATRTLVSDETAPTPGTWVTPASQVTQTASTYNFAYNAATDAASGVSTYHRVLQSSPLSAGSCPSWTNLTDLGNSTALTYAASGMVNGTCYRLAVSPIDRVNNGGSTFSYSSAVLVGAVPTLVVTDNTASVPSAWRVGNNVYFRGGVAGSVTLTADGTTSTGTITNNTFGALTGTPTGWSLTAQQSSATDPLAVAYSWGTTSPTTTTSVDDHQQRWQHIQRHGHHHVPRRRRADGAHHGSSGAGHTLSKTITFDAVDTESGFTRPGAGWVLTRYIFPGALNNGVCSGLSDRRYRRPWHRHRPDQRHGPTEHPEHYRTTAATTGPSASPTPVGNSNSHGTQNIWVDTTGPAAPIVTDSAPVGSYRPAGNTIFFRPAAAGTITLTSTGTDADTGIASSNFGALSASTGWTYTSGTVNGNPANKNLTWSGTAVAATLPITTTNGVGVASSATTIAFTPDPTAPTTSFTTPAGAPGTVTSQTALTLNVAWTETETGSGVGTRSLQRWAAAATASTQCAAATYSIAGQPVPFTGASPSAETGLVGNMCYQWRQTLTDRVGNQTTTTSANVFITNTAPPAPGAPDLDFASDSGPMLAINTPTGPVLSNVAIQGTNVNLPLTTGTFNADSSTNHLTPNITSTASATPTLSWVLTYTGYSGRMSTGIMCSTGNNDYDDNTSSGAGRHEGMAGRRHVVLHLRVGQRRRDVHGHGHAGDVLRPERLDLELQLRQRHQRQHPVVLRDEHGRRYERQPLRGWRPGRDGRDRVDGRLEHHGVDDRGRRPRDHRQGRVGRRDQPGLDRALRDDRHGDPSRPEHPGLRQPG